MTKRREQAHVSFRQARFLSSVRGMILAHSFPMAGDPSHEPRSTRTFGLSSAGSGLLPDFVLARRTWTASKGRVRAVYLPTTVNSRFTMRVPVGGAVRLSSTRTPRLPR